MGGVGLVLELGGGDKLVDVKIPGQAIEVSGSSVTVGLGKNGGAADSTGAAVSVALSVVSVGANGKIRPESGVVITEAGGALSVEPAEGRAATVSPPGKSLQAIEFSMSEKQGRNLTFEVLVTDGGIVIKPKTGLARATLDSNREVVISIAIAQARTQLNLSIEKLATVYLANDHDTK